MRYANKKISNVIDTMKTDDIFIKGDEENPDTTYGMVLDADAMEHALTKGEFAVFHSILNSHKIDNAFKLYHAVTFKELDK